MNDLRPQLPVLECTAVVYRVLAAAKWLESLPDAFLIRADEKQSGLSVCYNCTIAEARNSLKKSYGAATLHVGKVRTLHLDVVPDEPTHANIVGLPYKEDNPTEAERFASLLAKQARIVDRGLRKRPDSSRGD
jgi:hypothetical protein